VKEWYHEDWRFRIEALRVGKEGKAEECRLGLEPGDTFECTYGTPAGFCPTSFIKIFPSMEVVRCGGDLRNLGGEGPGATTVICPDGVVLFSLTAAQLPEEADSLIPEG
jgi:uncharacterized repeat protein (TIGR04076 family)